jgi:radical SAM protein with 4Fe4S-binding SPASM domain
MTPAEPVHRGLLAVEVTNRCNRSCLYCYKPDPPEPQDGSQELPASQLVDLVNRVLDESGISRVQISGGEPLLYDGLITVLEDLRKPERQLSLLTDGSLLDDLAVSELKRLGIAPVQPTLLSADRKLHNRLKGADCFDATVAAISRLRVAQVPVSVSFVCTRLNYTHFKNVVELCFALGINSIAFSRFCSTGQGLANLDDLMPDASMIAHCLKVAEEASITLGVKVHMAISLPHCVADLSQYPHLSFGRCALGTATPGFTMDPIGNLRACSISPTILGNLQEESWSTIITRARDGYFRTITQSPAYCNDCALLARCGGGCRESALGAAGTFGSVDPLIVSDT